jgi:hypothetical protein
MPARPKKASTAPSGTGAGLRKWRMGVVLALVGVGVIALTVQAVANSSGSSAHVAVGGATTTTTVAGLVVVQADPSTDQTLALQPARPGTPSPAAGTAGQASAAPATGSAPTTTARVPVPAASSLHPVGAAPPPVVTGGHTITTPGLWLVARDGSGLRRLLADRPDAVAWSPDDSHVALGRNGGVDILALADGSVTHLVSFGGADRVVSLAWSPSGLLLAANVMHHPYALASQGGPSNELFMVDAVKATSTSLGRIVGGAHPSWSGRGCLGWAYSTVDIWCPGGQLAALAPMPGSDQFAWAPDGARYAITSSDDAAPGAIRTYAADGTGKIDLANSGVYPMAWVGDGRSIVFETTHDPSSRLWVHPVAGGAASVLTNMSGPYVVNGVDDGVIIAIGRTPGPPGIVSLSVSDPTRHQLVAVGAGSGGIGALTWTRDGRWLLADAIPTP